MIDSPKRRYESENDLENQSDIKGGSVTKESEVEDLEEGDLESLEEYEEELPDDRS